MKKLCIIFLALYAGKASAQDPNFSQFFANPLTLNPALAGTGQGEARLGVNFRNTWLGNTSPFTTGSLAFDKAILKNKLQENDRFGIGGYALYDQSNGGALKSTVIAATVAYNKALDANGVHNIGIGFQGSYANRTLDYSKLTFEDQFTSGGYDPGIPTGDALNSKSRSYMDFNIGASYRYETQKLNANAGITINHIMRPNDYMWDDLNGKRRFTAHAGGSYKLNDDNRIEVNAIYQSRGNANELSLGGAYGLQMNANEKEPLGFWVGGYLRVNDAFYPYCAVDYRNVRAGISYDVTVSSMKSASQSRKSLEFSVIYRFTKKSNEAPAKVTL